MTRPLSESLSRCDGEATPPPPPAQASPSPQPSPDMRRLDTLFRIWLRDGRVHPLVHLMRRYRAEDDR